MSWLRWGGAGVGGCLGIGLRYAKSAPLGAQVEKELGGTGAKRKT